MPAQAATLPGGTEIGADGCLYGDEKPSARKLRRYCPPTSQPPAVYGRWRGHHGKGLHEWIRLPCGRKYFPETLLFSRGARRCSHRYWPYRSALAYLLRIGIGLGGYADSGRHAVPAQLRNFQHLRGLQCREPEYDRFQKQRFRLWRARL